MFGALKPGFRSLASLILVVNVVGKLEPKRIAAARHRTVSLQQQGFLVHDTMFTVVSCTDFINFAAFC